MPQRARRLKSVSPSPGIAPKAEDVARSTRYEDSDSDSEDKSDDHSARLRTRSTQPIRGRSSNFLGIPAGGFSRDDRYNNVREPSRTPSRNRSRSPAPQVTRLQASSPDPYQGQSQGNQHGLNVPVSTLPGHHDRFNNQQADGRPGDGSTSDSNFSMSNRYEPRRLASETTLNPPYNIPDSFLPSTAPRTPQLAQTEIQPYDSPQVGHPDRTTTTKVTGGHRYSVKDPGKDHWAENIPSPLPTNRPPLLYPAQSLKEPVTYSRQNRAPGPHAPPTHPPIGSDAATLVFRTGSGKPGDQNDSISGDKQSTKAPTFASIRIPPALDASSMRKFDVRSRSGNQITCTMDDSLVPSYPLESRGSGLNPDRAFSPPAILAPPPSPSTTKVPTRQRSTSNLRVPILAASTIRPRAKSASEERPPIINPVIPGTPALQSTSLQTPRVRSARPPEQDRISPQPLV